MCMRLLFSICLSNLGVLIYALWSFGIVTGNVTSHLASKKKKRTFTV